MNSPPPGLSQANSNKKSLRSRAAQGSHCVARRNYTIFLGKPRSSVGARQVVSAERHLPSGIADLVEDVPPSQGQPAVRPRVVFNLDSGHGGSTAREINCNSNRGSLRSLIRLDVDGCLHIPAIYAFELAIGNRRPAHPSCVTSELREQDVVAVDHVVSVFLYDEVVGAGGKDAHLNP